MTWSRADWDAFFATGAAPDCVVCTQPVDDPRLMVAVQVHRAWSPKSVRLAYAHVECLGRAVPHLI
jgi:hypothetical protein